MMLKMMNKQSCMQFALRVNASSIQDATSAFSSDQSALNVCLTVASCTLRTALFCFFVFFAFFFVNRFCLAASLMTRMASTLVATSLPPLFVIVCLLNNLLKGE